MREGRRVWNGHTRARARAHMSDFAHAHLSSARKLPPLPWAVQGELWSCGGVRGRGVRALGVRGACAVVQLGEARGGEKKRKLRRALCALLGVLRARVEQTCHW